MMQGQEKKGVVIKEINSTEDVGQVKVAGELWSAITLNDEKIKINEIVEVTKVDGVKLVVTKINENVQEEILWKYFL